MEKPHLRNRPKKPKEPYKKNLNFIRIRLSPAPNEQYIYFSSIKELMEKIPEGSDLEKTYLEADDDGLCLLLELDKNQVLELEKQYLEDLKKYKIDYENYLQDLKKWEEEKRLFQLKKAEFNIKEAENEVKKLEKNKENL